MQTSPRPRLLVFLISAAVLLPTLAFDVLRIVNPSDGARMLPGDADAWQPEGIVLTPILEPPGGLAPGDLLIAVNGESLVSRVETLLRFGAPTPRWEFGQTLTYTVVRSGETQDIQVTLGPYPLWAAVGENWATFFVILVILIVGLFLYWIRPGEAMTAATLFTAAALASTSAWSLGLQVSDLYGGWGFWLHKFCTVVAYLWIWAGLVHIALVFPKPRPIVVRYPWLLAVLYAAPLALHAIFVLLSHPVDSTGLAWLGRMGLDVSWMALGYVALTGAIAIHGYRGTREPISRLQVRWLLFAFVFISLAALGLGFLPDLIIGKPLVGWDWIGLTALTVPIALVIAVLRYRLFDIDVIINWTLVYVPLTAILAGGYAAANKLLQVLFVVATGNESDAAIIMATLVIAAIFTPIKNGLQSRVDRHFEEPHEPARQLRAFDQQIQGLIEALDPLESVRHLLQLAVEAYGSEGGAVYMHSNVREVLAHATPDWSGKESLRIPLEWNGVRVGRLSLGPRRSELARPVVPVDELETCAQRVAHLIHLVSTGGSRPFPSRRRPRARVR